MKEDKNHRKDFGWIEFYWTKNWRHRHFKIELEYRAHSGRKLGFCFAIPWIIFLYIKMKFPRLRFKEEYVLFDLSYHGKSIWWDFVTPRNEWSSETPRWRKGALHLDDFLFGKSVCTKEILEERDVLVPMPEKAYPAKAKLVLYTWTRPRWPVKSMKRVEIDVPEGIPHEGKGENSWDCGRDATFRMTTGECRSIAEGVGKLVGTVLNNRVRYGGWGDWKWEKP